MDTHVKCTKDQRESRRSGGTTGPPLDGQDRRVTQHRRDCFKKEPPYIRHNDKASGGLYAARDIVEGQRIMIPFGETVTNRKISLEDPKGRMTIPMAVGSFLRVSKQAFDMLLVPTTAPTRLDNAGGKHRNLTAYLRYVTTAEMKTASGVPPPTGIRS
jgi:hypothetical protein